MRLGDQTFIISTVTETVTQQASGPHSCLGLDHVGLHADDVVRAVQVLEAKGAKITMQPRSNGRTTIAIVEGPAGVSVELLSLDES